MVLTLEMPTAPKSTTRENPFHLSNTSIYAHWREEKLQNYPTTLDALRTEIADPFALTSFERGSLRASCRKTNMALYRLSEDSSDSEAMIRALGQQLGLIRLDKNLCADENGIASIRVVSEGRPQEYIPYSNRAIKWHTDGYYNDLRHQVRGFILHCVRDAAVGGGNALLDPEILYLLIRDKDPDFVAALSAPDAMAIPGNSENGHLLRPERPGPVFSVNDEDGTLHMRYTARTRSIRWRDDKRTRAARGLLEELLASDLPFMMRGRLAPGEGIICNNVLHTREAFTDHPAMGKQRLVLRARYLDRIAP